MLSLASCSYNTSQCEQASRHVTSCCGPNDEITNRINCKLMEWNKQILVSIWQNECHQYAEMLKGCFEEC
jgi:hypothetical protein